MHTWSGKVLINHGPDGLYKWIKKDTWVDDAFIVKMKGKCYWVRPQEGDFMEPFTKYDIPATFEYLGDLSGHEF